MVRYLTLVEFTEKGLRDVAQSPERASQFRASVETAGGRVVSLYWAIGQFDGCIVFEAPDEKTATRLLLSLGRQGNVRTRSMRLFDENEFASIVGKL